MADEFNDAVVRHVTGVIACRLEEAASVAKAAATLGSQGLSQNAVRTLLDADGLVYEAKTLLDAISLINRILREEDGQ